MHANLKIQYHFKGMLWCILGVLIAINAMVAQDNLYLQKAIASYASENWEDALYHLKKALQTASAEDRHQVFLYLGAVYVHKGNTDEARKYFRKAIEAQPLQDAASLPFSREVREFYQQLYQKYPVVDQLTFASFNPFDYDARTPTISFQIRNHQQLQTIELVIYPENGSIPENVQLQGMKAIQYWNAMVGEDRPIPSGLYRFTFTLTSKEGLRVQQHYLVEVTAGSPYGDQLITEKPVFYERDSSGDYISGLFLLSWVGWSVVLISDGGNVLQSCLLGGMLGFGTTYLLSPLAAIGSTVSDHSYNKKRKQEVEAERRRIDARNQQIRENYRVQFQLVQ